MYVPRSVKKSSNDESFERVRNTKYNEQITSRGVTFNKRGKLQFRIGGSE